MEEERSHKVVLENRERLTVSTARDIESFDDERVVVVTDMGTMTVNGGNFHISKLNVEDGQLVIEGEIDEIQYSDTVASDKGGGLFSRLFK